MVERELDIIELGKRWKAEIKALIARLRIRQDMLSADTESEDFDFFDEDC